MDTASFVVTGGAQGAGRAMAERLAGDGHVVVLDVATALEWDDPAVELVSGDGRDPTAAGPPWAPTRRPGSPVSSPTATSPGTGRRPGSGRRSG